MRGIGEDCDTATCPARAGAIDGEVTVLGAGIVSESQGLAVSTSDSAALDCKRSTAGMRCIYKPHHVPHKPDACIGIRCEDSITSGARFKKINRTFRLMMEDKVSVTCSRLVMEENAAIVHNSGVTRGRVVVEPDVAESDAANDTKIYQSGITGA